MTWYMVQIDPCQGAKHLLDSTKGLGYGVVTNLVSVLPANEPFHITFDNFVRTFDLMRCLTNKVLELLVLFERTSFAITLWIKNSWNQKKGAHVMSNKHGIYPLRKVNAFPRRRSQKLKSVSHIFSVSTIWWSPFFAFLIDVCINNPWLLHQMFAKKTDSPPLLGNRKF